MDREAVQERFGIIGTSPELRHVIDRIRLVAPTEISVLITGESGVGKELVAHALHQLSPRRHKPMLIINAGAIPEGLVESELFGAEKGAYTGAVARRTGYFEDADGGTIFLDELGEMPLNAQIRLLRVLESGEFSRVGSSTLLKTDVRVIGATNKNLGKEVQVGRFREDLYYRISTVQINIPPLRDRPADILPLFEHFQHRFAQQYNATIKRLDAEARELLERYRWPGNVRELRNTAEQAVVLVRGDTLTADQLRPLLRGVSSGASQGLVLASEARSSDSADARERELMYRLLLELRLDLREVKELLQDAASRGPLATHDAYSPPADYGRVRRPDDRNLPVPQPEPDNQFEWVIEDAPYEIQPDEEAPPAPETDEPDDAEPPLPTMAEAEQTLIREALRRFDGNRRQSAKALGISERTLYRKIKDMEDVDL